jgi:hypothetical protein
MLNGIGVKFAGALALCFLPMALVYGQTARQQRPQMAEEVYKNIRLLKGLPVDEFLDTMGFFSASTNLNCIDCHGAAAGGDWSRYADETPMKATARRMILMVQTINKQNFGGASFVSCYTCHRGDKNPKITPSLAVQYSEPAPDDPDEIEIDRQAAGAPSPDQLFDKYIQALGGAQPLAGLTSFVAKGTYSGYDTEFESVPVEIYAKTPGQRATVIHFRGGDSITTYDGRAGWISEADKPVPLIEMTGGELEGAKVDGAVAFAAGLRQIRATWKVGSTSIGDRDVFVAQGSGGPQPPVKLYFDKQSGLLVRQVRYTQLPVGRVPAQFDYTDYREVAGTGVKMSFKWTATWVDGRSTTTLTEVQPNPPIDAARFAKPPAASKPAAR